DEEADEELAPERLEESVGEEVAEHDDEELRDEGEDEGIAKGPQEDRAGHDVPEVLQSHEGEVEAPRRGIGQAEKEGEKEGQGHEQENVGEGGGEEQLAQPSVAGRQGLRGLQEGRGGDGLWGF